jgi:uncharacterized protein YlaI
MDIADFTTNAAKPAVCARCDATVEKENDLFYMQDRKPDRPGKYVCGGCREHYHKKTEERLKTLERSKI